MGNVTINGDLTGTAVGGLVGGAANLTTAGAIPYVSSAGVLNQDATALFWDAANDRLGVGTNVPSGNVDVVGYGTFRINAPNVRYLQFVNAANNVEYGRIGTESNGSPYFASGSMNSDIGLYQQTTARLLVKGVTGNVVIGTTTDDATNKLQISGSSNGLKINFTDQTATGGTTISEASTERAYLQWVGSTFATTNRRQQIELINLLGGISFWTASSEKARFAGSTGNLLIGTTTDDGSNKLQVSGSARVLSAGIATLKVDGGTTQGQWATGTGFSSIGTVTNDPLVFYTNNVNAARFAPTTGNLLVGTSTDSNFKLDVAASGSAGTARFYGGSGVSNSTKVVVQAGGGQSTNLQEWQNSGGTVLSSVAGDGTFRGAYNLPSDQGIWYSGGSNARLSLGNNGTVLWNSSATWYGGSNDLSLSRASAGVLQVGDGGANANGVVSLTRSQHAGVLVAALPAAAAGNAGSIQYVTDANATTIGSTVAGGGANKVMVWSDGAAWKIFAS